LACTGNISGAPTSPCAYGTEVLCEADQCCDWTPGPSVCSGSVTAACYGMGKEACDAHPCCWWIFMLGYCGARLCTDVTPDYCVSCGCSLGAGEGSCAAGCGGVSDPDLCAGCDTCDGDWQISNDRGDMPWSILVTGKVDMQASGKINVVSARTLDCNDMNFAASSQVSIASGTITVG